MTRKSLRASKATLRMQASQLDELTGHLDNKALTKIRLLEKYCKVRAVEVHDFGTLSLAVVALVPKHEGTLVDNPSFNLADLSGLTAVLKGMECDIVLTDDLLNVYLEAT